MKPHHENQDDVIQNFISQLQISQKHHSSSSSSSSSSNSNNNTKQAQVESLLVFDRDEEDEYRRRRRIQERTSSTRRPIIGYRYWDEAFSDIKMAQARRSIMNSPQKEGEEYETEGSLLFQAALSDVLLVMHIVGSNPSMLRYRDSVDSNNMAMHVAARAGSKNTVARLLKLITRMKESQPENIVNLVTLIDESNRDGDTPLHLALKHHHKEVAFDLIKGGAMGFYRRNYVGLSPLYLAIKAGYKDLVEEIFNQLPWSSLHKHKRKRVLQAKKKGSLVHEAIKARDLGMLQILLDNIPALMEVSDEKGWKPLSYAAFQGYVDETRYLLDKFPDYSGKCDEDGYFPIHKAVVGGNVGIVQEFLSICPETMYHTSIKRGRSVLHVAVEYGRADVLSFLVQKPELKQIFDLRDVNGNTFVDLAKQLMDNK